MFGVGMSELIVVLIIVLLIFGVGRVPQLGRDLGKGWRNFNRARKGKDEIDITPRRVDHDSKET